MIWLSSDCLLFELANGERIPFSAENVSVELMGDTAGDFEPEFLQHAAASVFHYFKHDLGRTSVTVAEFAEVLERVLRSVGYRRQSSAAENPAGLSDADLRCLAHETGEGGELMFYPRLRDALRGQLDRSPRLVRFCGLRGCVKQLAGARRWSPRCETLHGQILGYLRECLSAEIREMQCTLVVE